MLALLLPPLAAQQMVRDQVVFVGQDPDVILLVAMQRELGPEGPVAEAKAFLAWEQEWRTPYWERVALKAWPGAELSSAVDAWRAAGGGSGLRLSVEGDGSQRIDLRVRTPNQALRVEARSLQEVPGGSGPHGDFTRRAGKGLLWVGDEPVAGVVAWEQLSATVAQPSFGEFEMWLLAPDGGGLVWGRDQLDVPGPGEALRVATDGSASVSPFAVQIVGSRPETGSGRDLPSSWSVDDLALTRRGGELGRGTTPAGDTALYDVSLAAGAGAQGLVLHLEDGDDE